MEFRLLRIILLLAVNRQVLAKQSQSIDEEICGEAIFGQSTSRIVGGDMAVRGEWPWQAMISAYDEQTGQYVLNCGGTLIKNQWVLTAAHCFERISTPDQTQVALGAHFRNLSSDSVQLFTPEEIVCHEAFKGTSNHFADICLLKLPVKIAYTDYIRPVCLPDGSIELGEEDVCVITGWGDTQGTGSEEVLREASVGIIPKTQCQSWYQEVGKSIPEDHFCAGYPSGGVDSCQGDSGGPLVCRASGQSRYTQHGITSFGYNCAQPERPGVYTDVQFYLEWLDETIAQHSIEDTTPQHASTRDATTPAVTTQSEGWGSGVATDDHITTGGVSVSTSSDDKSNAAPTSENLTSRENMVSNEMGTTATEPAISRDPTTTSASSRLIPRTIATVLHMLLCVVLAV